MYNMRMCPEALLKLLRELRPGAPTARREAFARLVGGQLSELFGIDELEECLVELFGTDELKVFWRGVELLPRRALRHR
eukprot:4811493-Pyramimonas_sp.AAC.1